MLFSNLIRQTGLLHYLNQVLAGFQPNYILKPEKVENFILAPKFYDADFENLKLKHSLKADLISIKQLVDDGILFINTGDEVGKMAYGTGEVPYIRTSDISDWGIKLNAKHFVDDETYNRLKIKQDIQEGDILMVKDGTYLIGTVALITESDTKIVYQSHIYKIRLNKNIRGLTPYNFLALLSSNFVQRQIKSKQLTQDIIDSLGKRIYDLLIPIPKDRKVLDQINKQVQLIINLKEKSRNKTVEVQKTLNTIAD